MRSSLLLRSQLQNEGWALVNACSSRVGSSFPSVSSFSAAAAEHTVSTSGAGVLLQITGAAGGFTGLAAYDHVTMSPCHS